MRKIVNKPEWKSFVFYGLLLIPTFFLCYGNNFVFFVVLIAMLLTSVIEIPVYAFRTKKPEYSANEAKCMGELYGVPVLEEMQSNSKMSYTTRITLNLGGFIIPLLFSFYLIFSFCQEGSCPLPLLELSMCTFLIVLFTYMLSVVKGGVGILVPNYVGIFAIPLGFVLAPSGLPIEAVAGLLIFVPAILGIIVGMLILLVSRSIEEVGSAFYNLGGIGSFHTIYLISLLALLIGAISVCS
ncbi:putative membrane protein [Methanophagales archaeon]|nr:putative membrane protein [Methanophagales archaeon]